MGSGTNGLEGRSYQGIGLAARKHGKDIVIAFLAVLCIAFGALWTRAQGEVNAFATRATSGYDVVETYESPSHDVGGYSHGAYASLAILHPERDGMEYGSSPCRTDSSTEQSGQPTTPTSTSSWTPREKPLARFTWRTHTPPLGGRTAPHT